MSERQDMEDKGFSAKSSADRRKRFIALIVLIAASFSVYAVYLFSLQIVNGLEYQSRATQVARRVVSIPAARGEIYDRNYDVPLVLNIPSFAVDVIPAEVPRTELPILFTRLAEILEISEESIHDKIRPEHYHLYQPMEVLSGVSFGTITRIAERIEEFPGVTWRDKPIRSYLETGSLSHVLGYVGNITSEDLQVLYNQGYERNALLGRMGIEKQYDQVLRGKDGVSFKTVDVKGRSVSQESAEDIPPETGKNLVLTIDRHIQTLCEKALGERIGSVVVLKPSTGEVLALVSYPYYDPNIFNTRGEYETYKELSLDSRFPFLNRAIQASYPPASSFKLIMTTAVLEDEVFNPEKKINCEGQIRYGDRTFSCHVKHGHGPLNLGEALAQSCNVFFYTMGTEYLGVERIVDFSRRFGLGQITGLDLPGEKKGLVPSPQWKEEVYNTHWLGGDTVNISIGQGYLSVTPLQMANAVAMIVNEGVNYRPFLVKEVRDPVTGEVLKETEPTVLHTSSIRESTFQKVKEYMRGVITEGTARYVILTDAVEVAGKTGTGEAGFEESWNSWFVAYAPYDSNDPDEQIVVVVQVEPVNQWEWWAPKAADMIFHGIFTGQTYEEVTEELKNVWYLRELRERE
ncbi:MAG: penicillin-binding protein 2 [Spirochaetales bacterium]|nr:penicillin-binding protein 2 [Spirochaetales bacterium]